MDGERFDAWTRAVVGLTDASNRASRRHWMRSLIGGSALLLGVGAARSAAAGDLLPGDPCTTTEECSQATGAVVCADNGIASDGALNCCRGEGGSCTSGAGCCRDFLCADNGIASDGTFNCCHNEGGGCTSGAGCCGSLRCDGGLCRSASPPDKEACKHGGWRQYGFQSQGACVAFVAKTTD
jgi:hypothetical protein